MRSIPRTHAVVAAASLALLAGSNAARAVPVVPVVSDSSAAAATVGSVPVSLGGLIVPLSDFAIDVQPTAVDVSKTVTAAPDGAETADGRAKVDVDAADINNSVVRSRSEVSTSAPPPPAPLTDFHMTDISLAGLNATLSTTGLAPGDTANVDVQINVTGSLVYRDPRGLADVAILEDPFDPSVTESVPDVSANVSVLVALANVLDVADFPIPDPLPFVPLFNGSVTLQSTAGAGTAPELVRGLDWADPSRDGDFVFGSCDAFTCQVDIAMTLLFQDVQSLGFGETFDIGLLLLTNADAISDQDTASGRMVAANFFDSAHLAVNLDLVENHAAPEPGSLVLLALALVALGLGKNGPRRAGAGAGLTAPL